ncbi:MAG: hypothetical protein HN742_20120 [Lentisphaerae bacterium]|nr:hypothetical protein [Lentisphaerota bacterium]MBT5609714.1 hypothetical protein [Lentisphaerota bacterium]MBT7061450.1 hypothetical protein [Lentisphaerota bacterium]MBT7844198.1 hypothetical protein [Lentisphaerota bacterium]
MKKTHIWAVVLSLFTAAFPTHSEDHGEATRGGAPTTHTVAIKHPAFAKPKPMQFVVVKDENGEPTDCYMDADLGSRGNGLRSVGTVRIYWDALGNYRRYGLPSGGQLMKKGNKPFTRADTRKLNSLLADARSPLKTLIKGHVSAPGKSGIKVDATTGATPAAIRKVIVPGAAYTCYMLWHWVNGDARAKAREVAGKTCSVPWLSRCLDTGTEASAVFAMEQFARRGIHDKATVEAILRRAQEGSGRAVKGCLRYLEDVSAEAGSDIYFAAMERLVASAGKYTLILYIDSLSEITAEPPKGCWDRLSAWLPRQDTYYPMHRLLKLMEERNPGSAEVARQATLVLDNENFVIARRAFWFLEKQALTTEQKTKVNAFRETYKDRL